MINLPQALAAGTPRECTLTGTVVSAPHRFYGTRTHAEHEEFYIQSQGRRLEVVENLGLAPDIPALLGDEVTLHGELIPHGSHGPLIHWIHHDPQGRHEDRFAVERGKRYD